MQIQIKDKVEEYIDNYSTDATQAKAMRLGIIFTGIIWFILLIILAISPGWNRPKKYKTVRITLEPSPVVKTEKEIASAAQAAKASSPVPEQKAEKSAPKQEIPAAKKVEQPKPVSKPEPAKSQAPQQTKTEAKSAEPKKASYKIKGETSEIPTTPTKKSVSDFDWSSLDTQSESVSTNSSSASNNVTKIDNSSSLGGSAGTKAQESSVTSTSSVQKSSGTVSENTLKNLAAVGDAVMSDKAVNGIKSALHNGVSVSGEGKVSMNMSDGSSRVLLEPEDPGLVLSKPAAEQIENSRQLKIIFTIKSDGSVPYGDIYFEPSSALPSIAKSEIKEQISKWRFSVASSDGQARFDYSIIKR